LGVGFADRVQVDAEKIRWSDSHKRVAAGVDAIQTRDTLEKELIQIDTTANGNIRRCD
jgi:hypothetical protein